MNGSESSSAAKTQAKTYGNNEVMLMLCRALFATMLAKYSMNIEWVSDDDAAAAHKQNAVAALQVDFDKKAAKEALAAAAQAQKRGDVTNAVSTGDSMITARSLSGNSIRIRCDLTKDASSTVQSLKFAVQKEQGIPVDQQRLIFSGCQFENGRTLHSYGVKHDSVVHRRWCKVLLSRSFVLSFDSLYFLRLAIRRRANAAFVRRETRLGGAP
jgi:hypothetical protein